MAPRIIKLHKINISTEKKKKIFESNEGVAGIEISPLDCRLKTADKIMNDLY